MLANAQRLRCRAEFQAAVRAGRRAGRGSLVVHLHTPAVPHTPPVATASEPVRDEGQLPPARAGFVVPRAVGGAVVRNRVRRRLRHLVRERVAELPAGAVLVVRVLPGAGDASYQELGLSLDAALTATRAPRRPQASGGSR
ncbi:MAG TPA: ribonuclease P protein component [Micromonosporaceae bacterium]|nr:ribonuclease P protein component [Micromonosporaceae bacterium]